LRYSARSAVIKVEEPADGRPEQDVGGEEGGGGSFVARLAPIHAGWANQTDMSHPPNTGADEHTQPAASTPMLPPKPHIM
jgi:hypothetical protein